MFVIFSEIQEDAIDNTRIQIFGSSILSFLAIAGGHEVFGHGYLLRRYDIPREYTLRPAVIYRPIDNPIIMSQIYIGGMKFNREFENEFIKNGIVEFFDYKKSTVLFYSEMSYLNRLLNQKESDFDQYINNLKGINQDTDIDKYLKRNVMFSVINPPFLLSSYILYKSLVTNDSVTYDIKYIPTISFNLYPIAVTQEIGLSFKKSNSQYMKLAYETGHNVWNDDIDGFSFEYTNIPIYKMISIDFKIHYVEECESYMMLKIDLNKVYLGWKHQYHQFTDLETVNKFSIGISIL
jgi:hypothetical protein